ncbi:MAG: GAF domain-containing protein [Terriglobia bacterium]
MSDNQAVLRKAEMMMAARATNRDWLRAVCYLLRKERKHFNWIGIYLLEGNALVLSSYVGEPSPHTCIPIDKGICGAAVRERKTIVVPDVNADPRYLACSVETKSEIVVPIEANGRILGEIDVDSHTPDAFTAADRDLLEQVALRLAEVLAPTPRSFGGA